jgi:hypothetical protein
MLKSIHTHNKIPRDITGYLQKVIHKRVLINSYSAFYQHTSFVVQYLYKAT